VKASSDQAPD